MEGTGFVVSVPFAGRPEKCFTHLVTANHVLDASNKKDLLVRANLKSGSAADLTTDGDRWWGHPDGCSVDVAVLPLDLDDELDVRAIPQSTWLTDDGALREKGIGVGDDVFVIGLFRFARGEKRNSPIVRSGNVAMLPKEKIPVTDVRQPSVLVDVDAHLIEARSIGGLTGSPVFVRESIASEVITRPTPTRPSEKFYTQAPGRWYLLGLVHGHWDIDERDINSRRARRFGPLGVNLGVAIVVPASKILETINRQELLAMRAKAEYEWRTRSS